MKDIHNWIMGSHYWFMDILNCELFIIELWIYNVYASKYKYHNWIVYFYIIVLWIHCEAYPIMDTHHWIIDIHNWTSCAVEITGMYLALIILW